MAQFVRPSHWDKIVKKSRVALLGAHASVLVYFLGHIFTVWHFLSMQNNTTGTCHRISSGDTPYSLSLPPSSLPFSSLPIVCVRVTFCVLATSPSCSSQILTRYYRLYPCLAVETLVLLVVLVLTRFIYVSLLVPHLSLRLISPCPLPAFLLLRK